MVKNVIIYYVKLFIIYCKIDFYLYKNFLIDDYALS